MDLETELRQLQPQPTATIRRTIAPADTADTLDEVLPEVWTYLERSGTHPAGPPFARWHVWEADRADLEAGMPVPAPVEGEGRIAASELPGGTVAVTVHRGPYDSLPDTYNALGAWMEANGHEHCGAPWEVYLTDPRETPEPADYQTEVYWPVR